MQGAKRRRCWTEMSGYWQTPWLTGSRQGPSNVQVEGGRNISNHKKHGEERKKGKLNDAWLAVRSIGQPSAGGRHEREKHATSVSVQSSKCTKSNHSVGQVGMYFSCMSKIAFGMF